MLKTDLQVDDVVLFGRKQGEKTRGRILKLNPKKAKVETLESRGNGRGSVAGTTWVVPYSLIFPAGDDDATPVTNAPPLTYSPFDDEDNAILTAIYVLYGKLEPERLSCDGELSRTEVRRRYRAYNAKLRALFAALGREVNEEDAYAWDESRREHESQRNPPLTRV